MKPLYIYGAGGFGREVAWLVERINESATKQGNEAPWELKGFIDDNTFYHNKVFDNYMVCGGFSILEKSTEQTYCVIAIGNPTVRKYVAERISQKTKNVIFATLIDPTAIVGRTVSIGEGSIICAGTIATVDIKIGPHSIVNLDCTIGHDVVLDGYTTLYPGVHVSGCVEIGSSSEIGTGTAIIQGIKIGSSVTIGANSTVIRDIEDSVTAVGTPARVIKHS